MNFKKNEINKTVDGVVATPVTPPAAVEAECVKNGLRDEGEMRESNAGKNERRKWAKRENRSANVERSAK